MKVRITLLILLTAVFASAAGWFAARHGSSTKRAEAAKGRQILYYQSAMHPWIKSEKPGNCTICGMKLVPVYEGEKGFEASADVVSLPANSITVVNVQTEAVKRRPLVHSLRVAGRIDDDDTRHRIVSAYIDGRIEKLSVNYVGAEIVEGQSLATFYSPQLLTAEREYLTLLRNGSTLNPISVNSAALGTEHGNLLHGAAQRLKRLGLTDVQIEQLGQKQETETHTEIRAPMSGTVVSRSVYEGQYVKEGDRLFEIADFSIMWFVFDAYERDLSWIKPGEIVEITTPAAPGKVLTAPITFVDPNINDMTRSAKVRVEVPNPVVEENGRKHRLLYHRLYAAGRVKAEMPETLVVSRSAVLSPGQQAVAYVDLGGGSYQQRKLKLGRMGDDAWEVLEGLREGDRVVTAGNLLLDAQAQFNQSAQQGVVSGHEGDTRGPQASEALLATRSSESAVTDASSIPGEKLNDAQKKAAHDFLVLADALGTALSADKLDTFNKEAVRLNAMLPSLKQAFAAAKPWQALLENINQGGRFDKASDLKGARKAFLPFSNATVEFAKQLRHADRDFAGVKLFQCPMTNRVFPGAPKSAQWLQLQIEIRNPFFGAEMLDCGTEVR